MSQAGLWAPPWLERKAWIRRGGGFTCRACRPACAHTRARRTASCRPELPPFSIILTISESLTRRNAICSSSSRLVSPDVRPSAKEDLHRLAHKAGAGIVLDQRLPLLCAVAGLLGKLPLAPSRGLRPFELTGRQLPQETSGGMAILPLDDNPGRRALAFRVVDGQDDGAALWRTMSRVASLPPGSMRRVAHHMEERPSKTVSELSSSAVSSAAGMRALGPSSPWALRLSSSWLQGFCRLERFFILGFKALPPSALSAPWASKLLPLSAPFSP